MSQPSQPRAGPSREISTATVLSPDGAATATTAYSGPTNEPKEDQGKKRKTAGWRHFVAGGVGGMTGAIVTSPFDVVKTRLQSDLFREASHPAPPKTNFLPHRLTHALPIPNGRPTGARGLLWNFVETSQMIRNIYVQEGPRALFKGLGPTLVGVVPARAINFSTYAQSKTFLAGHFPQLAAEGAVTGTDGVSAAEASPYIHLSAATIAGITTATVTNPIWVVKTRLQLDARHKENQEQALSRQRAAAGAGAGAGSGSRSTLAATASQIRSYSKKAVALEKPTAVGRKMLPAFSMTIDIMKKEGLPGLYKGLSASYLGVTEGVIQWVLYERLKKISTSVKPGQEAPTRLGELAGIIASSGGAKMVASLITYPHEVLRTRLRQPPVTPGARPKYTGLLQTLKLVIKEEGAASLYGGLSAHLMRVVPNAACMFTIYEIALRL